MSQKTNKAQLTLMNLKPTRLDTPNRWLIYGPPGAGKTTLALDAPDVLLMDVEGGSTAFEATRYPFHPGRSSEHIPTTFEDIMVALDLVVAQAHNFKTLVIDQLAEVQRMLWEYICRRDKKRKDGTPLKNIEDYGWAKGYIVALTEWRHFLAKLDRIRYSTHPMTIILLSHSANVTHKDPATVDYHRTVPQLHEKARDFIEGWSDVVGFLRHDEGAKSRGENKRAIGWSTGKHVLYFNRKASHNAKTRLDLPTKLVIPPVRPWSAIADALELARDPKELIKVIENELRRIGDDGLSTKVRAAVKAAKKNARELARFYADLQTRPTKEQDNA